MISKHQSLISQMLMLTLVLVSYGGFPCLCLGCSGQTASCHNAQPTKPSPADSSCCSSKSSSDSHNASPSSEKTSQADPGSSDCCSCLHTFFDGDISVFHHHSSALSSTFLKTFLCAIKTKAVTDLQPVMNTGLRHVHSPPAACFPPLFLANQILRI